MLDLYKYSKNEIDTIIKSMVILVDTREKENGNEHILAYFDKKKIPYKKKALDYGDYSFMIPKNEDLNIDRDLYFDKKIMAERKGSLEELSGNVTKERARLEKELALAPDNKVIVIEQSTYEDVVKGNYNSKLNKKSVWATMFSWWHKYKCPIVFIPNSCTGSYMKGFFIYYLKNNIRKN